MSACSLADVSEENTDTSLFEGLSNTSQRHIWTQLLESMRHKMYTKKLLIFLFVFRINVSNVLIIIYNGKPQQTVYFYTLFCGLFVQQPMWNTRRLSFSKPNLWQQRHFLHTSLIDLSVMNSAVVDLIGTYFGAFSFPCQSWTVTHMPALSDF